MALRDSISPSTVSRIAVASNSAPLELRNLRDLQLSLLAHFRKTSGVFEVKQFFFDLGNLLAEFFRLQFKELARTLVLMDAHMRIDRGLDDFAEESAAS